MNRLMESASLLRILREGITKGQWTLEDLDKPSPGFVEATRHYSPQFGSNYVPPVWTNPLRDQLDTPPDTPTDYVF